MLIIASTVFLYYTVWTLLMVNLTCIRTSDSCFFLTYDPALRRRFASRPKPLSPARLGHSDPSHPPASRRRGGWQLPQYCHDSKQPQEGTEGEAKGEINGQH